jgi:hypothetical protein
MPRLLGDPGPGFAPCQDGAAGRTAEAVFFIWLAARKLAIERDPGFPRLYKRCLCAQRDLAFSGPAGHMHHER